MSILTYPHIEIDSTDEPVIEGTGTKAIMIALDRLAHLWDSREIHRQRPHLTLGQIHSALAYYYDHEVEMNAKIEERTRLENQLLDEHSASRVRATLQSAKRSN